LERSESADSGRAVGSVLAWPKIRCSTTSFAKISEFGWSIRHVGPGTGRGEAAFSYTIGLTAMDHPEVVCTGLPFDHAQIYLNNVGSCVRDGQRFPPGSTTEDFTEPGAPVYFIRAIDVSGLTAVTQVYGQVEAVQMVWPDSAGRLPWHVGYRNAPDAQPLLGLIPEH
jgi:hypothetical protein